MTILITKGHISVLRLPKKSLLHKLSILHFTTHLFLPICFSFCLVVHFLFSRHAAFNFLSWKVCQIFAIYNLLILFIHTPNSGYSWWRTTNIICYILCWIPLSKKRYNSFHYFKWLTLVISSNREIFAQLLSTQSFHQCISFMILSAVSKGR